MPVNKPSPLAPQNTPSSTQGSGSIMSVLYRLRIGPVNTDYYQRHFDRFETQGKATPTWNYGAAFFTLAWLLMRQMLRPAAIYAGCLFALVLLWWGGLHERVPMAVEVGIVATVIAALCLLPGLMGNALYYHHVRNETLAALNSARTLTHTQTQLQANPVSKERLNIAVASQAVASLVITVLLASQTQWAQMRLAEPTVSSQASGPPDIVIPPVGSTIAPQPALTPDIALSVAAEHVTEPAESSQAVASITPSAAPATSTHKEDELSVLTMAQAIPAQAEPSTSSLTAAATTATTAAAAAATSAAASAVPATVATAAVATPAPVTPAATTKAVALPKPAAAPVPKTTAKPAPAAKPKPAPSATPKPVTTASKPAPAKPSPATRTVGGMVPGKFYLNAGVYGQIANVERSVKTLSAANLPVLRQTVSSNKGQLTRLRVGPFDTRAQAERAAAQARRLRFEVSIFQQPLK